MTFQSYTYWESLFRSRDLIEISVTTSSRGHDSESNALLALSALVCAVRDAVDEVEEDARKELPTTFTAFEQNTVTALLSVANGQLNR